MVLFCMNVFPLSLGWGGRSTLANFIMFLSPSSFYTASLPAAHLSADESCSRIKIFARGFGIECPLGLALFFIFRPER